jgi:hypothetical protein
MTQLADAQTVRRWAMSHARNLTMATMRAFRRETGQGISRQALIELTQGTRMSPTLDDYEVLPTPLPDPGDTGVARARLRGIVDAVRHASRPADLNRLAPQVAEVAQVLDDVTVLAQPWAQATHRLEEQAHAALDVAGGVEPSARVDVARLSFAQALRSQDKAVIRRWGQDALESARFSRADLYAVLGLEVLLDDALVRARDLTGVEA